MGCLRSGSSILIFCIALLVALLSWITVSTWPGATASGEERPPVRGGRVSAARERQGGFAEAAEVVAERLAAAFPRITGLIIGFEGNMVLIDRGSADGVIQGMELDVFREGGEFKHPLTGEVLGRLDKDLGTLGVLHVRERYAEATIVKKSEKAAFQKGDRVRVSMARMMVAFPNVDAEGIGGLSVRSTTKELAAALVRTGRFELIEDRQLRSMLMVERDLGAPELADPKNLKQLADKGKIQVLLLSRLMPSADGVSLEVQAYSTLTGHSVVLASAPVQPGIVGSDRPARRPQPAPTARSVTPSRPEKPAVNPALPPKSLPDAAPILESVEAVVFEPALDGSVTAMGVADLDGDGKSELLAAVGDRLLAFRFEGSRLRSLAEYPFGGGGSVTTLEAIDVTGDGRAEIVLTVSADRHVRAIVLQWVDGKFKPISERPDIVFRALSPEGKTVQLYGQTTVPADRAAQPIHQYTWDGRTLHAGPVLNVPSGLSLLEFTMADVNGDGAMRLLTFKRGTLEVGALSGNLIGSYKVSGGTTAEKNRKDPRILINRERDGERPQIIVAREQGTEGRLSSWWGGRMANGLAMLKWDGTKFDEAWQTQIADGALSDYAVANLGGGLGRRLLAAVVRSGRLGWSTKSEIHAFRIP